MLRLSERFTAETSRSAAVAFAGVVAWAGLIAAFGALFYAMAGK